MSTYECPRCKENYCDCCEESKEVDFEIKEFIDHVAYFHRGTMEWGGAQVCFTCYEQLKRLAEDQEKCQHKNKMVVEAQTNKNRLEICKDCKKPLRWL